MTSPTFVRSFFVVACALMFGFGCSLFRDVGAVGVDGRDASADVSEHQDADGASDVGTDLGSDVPSDTSASAGCIFTRDCPAGSECFRAAPDDPLTLVCRPAECGCTEFEWCDDLGRCRGGTPCAAEADCGGGQVCSAGNECLGACESTEDCAEGLECVDREGLRVCVFPVCRCVADLDYCDGEGACVRAGIEGCEQSDCPTSALYACDSEGDGRCACTEARCFECRDDNDCDEFERCSAEGLCYRASCGADADCPGMEVCGWVEELGPVCIAPGAAAVGEPCADSTECASAMCFDGLCSEPCRVTGDCAQDETCLTVANSASDAFHGRCTGDANCGACAAGEVCDEGECGAAGCFTSATCQAMGLTCLALPGRTLGSCANSPSCGASEVYLFETNSCVGRCTDDLDCRSDEVCRNFLCTSKCLSNCECATSRTCDGGICRFASACSDACNPDEYCALFGGECHLPSGECRMP